MKKNKIHATIYEAQPGERKTIHVLDDHGETKGCPPTPIKLVNDATFRWVVKYGWIGGLTSNELRALANYLDEMNEK